MKKPLKPLSELSEDEKIIGGDAPRDLVNPRSRRVRPKKRNSKDESRPQNSPK